MMKSLLVLLIFSFFCASSFAQMGSKPTFPEGEASRQGKLPDTVVVLCTSINEEIRQGHGYVLCDLYMNHKLSDTSPSLFTKDNVKDIFVLLTQVDSNKLLITDSDYSLLKFLRLKTTLNDLSYTIFDSTDYFVNDEEYRIISWEDGISIKLYENDIVYSSMFYDWREFWECSEKLDYTPAFPYAVPVSTDLIQNYEVEGTKLDYISEWFHPNFVFSIISLKDENNEWLDGLKGRTIKVKRKLSEVPENVIVEINGKGVDLNGDNITDAFWYIEKGSGNLIEWYARLYLNIGGVWTPVWFQYFNEFY